MKISINTDGGARGNPGPAASAFVVKDGAGNVLEKRGKSLGEATNNFAEYSGVVLAWDWLLGRLGGLSEIVFYLDSQLVVNQLNGKFKIKNGELRKLAEQVKEMEKQIGVPVKYEYVPREKNFEADKLVNETLDKELSQAS